MRAIAKVRPGPGVDIVEVPEPDLRPGHVKVRVEAGSVCGTDLHIHRWDAWSASRIVPPRIIGHEFCGTLVDVADDVVDREVGQFVASESHIVCGTCRQCRSGQAHVCVNTRILGVDVDGGFAEYAVIPAANARPTDPSVPRDIAAFQDALGNAVHTALAGPVTDQTLLITGMGPIGLFAVAICRAMGARRIYATEVSPTRIAIAEQMRVDRILRPDREDVAAILRDEVPEGVDGTLEMSGHPSSLALAVEATRPGGRISLLGVYRDPVQPIDMDAVIFKGLTVQGIVGRRLWETWVEMGELLRSGKLDLEPVITHRMAFTEFREAMELLEAGQAGKVVFRFS